MEPDEHERIALAFRALPRQWQDILWRADVAAEPAHPIASLMTLPPDDAEALLILARTGLREAYQDQLQAGFPPSRKSR